MLVIYNICFNPLIHYEIHRKIALEDLQNINLKTLYKKRFSFTGKILMLTLYYKLDIINAHFQKAINLYKMFILFHLIPHL